MARGGAGFGAFALLDGPWLAQIKGFKVFVGFEGF